MPNGSDAEKSKTNRCSKCNGTGWVLFIGKDGNEYAKECDCGMLESERQANKLKFASIPDAYKDVSIRNISTKYYQKDESKKIIKSVCETIKYWLEHLDAMTDNGKGLYLWSLAKGSGKTMMAAAITNELLNTYGKSAKFSTSTDILDEIRASYGNDSDTNESKLLGELATAEYLVIDDMGTERVTDWVGEKFYTIVNKRYINKKVTIFTSNYNIKDLPYDDRITNRITERCFNVHFPEESCRDLKAKIENVITAKENNG